MADPPSVLPSRPSFAYPVPCPNCGQVTGQPYDVFMAGRYVAITVYLECEACKHQWAADAPSPLIRRNTQSRAW